MSGAVIGRLGLEALLRPRSIAVVGASPRTFVGGIALRNCRSLGFAGGLTPVHPRHDEVGGLPAVPSIGALEAPPDVVLVQVATARVLDVVSEAVAAGARNFVVPGAGYTDSGEDAEHLVAGLRALAAEVPIRVAGPNCMGIVDLVTGAAPYVGTVPSSVRRGRVALVAQSGAIAEAFVNAGGRVPLSTVVSSGTEALVGMAHYLEFFAADEHTGAVLAFVEGFTDAAGFLQAARRLADAGKPLAVCKVGRSDVAQAGVTAHSGALAGSHRVAEAALRQAGAVLCDDLDELLTAGEVLGAGRFPLGRRVHIVTNSGGEANLLADLADGAGLELPPVSAAGQARLHERWPRFHVGNPMDPWGVDDYPQVYPLALDVAASEAGDVVIMSIDQQTTCGDYEQGLGREVAGWLADATERHGRTPVMLSPASQDPPDGLRALCRARDVPLLRGARAAMNVLGALAERSAWRPPEASPFPGRATSGPLPSALDEDAALAALERYGAKGPRRTRAGSVDEAVTAAQSLGFPVVVKALAPSLAHKSDHGFVRVGLGGVAAVSAAAADVLAAAQSIDPDAALLVSEHVRGDLELIVGFRRDAQFGPTVLCGLGGVWTEALDEAAVWVGRISAADVARWLDGSVAGRLLRTARGGPLATDAVVEVICAVSAFGWDHPDVAAVEINPLVVGPDHAIAVDALVEGAGSHQRVGSEKGMS